MQLQRCSKLSLSPVCLMSSLPGRNDALKFTGTHVCVSKHCNDMKSSAKVQELYFSLLVVIVEKVEVMPVDLNEE